MEEVIDGGTHFDVRWNVGAIPDLSIEDRHRARAGKLCGPELVPCGHVPAIMLACRLPLPGAGAVATRRGFSPSGGEGGHLATPPWPYDPVQAWVNPSFGFSVFDAG